MSTDRPEETREQWEEKGKPSYAKMSNEYTHVHIGTLSGLGWLGGICGKEGKGMEAHCIWVRKMVFLVA